MRRILTPVAFVLATTVALSAIDAVGTIQKIDVENGVLVIHTAGQDRSVKLDSKVKVLGIDDQPLAGGVGAEELKAGTEVTFTIDIRANAIVVSQIRLGKRKGAIESKASVGLKPLSEMTAGDDYKGEDGGLYGGGRNEPPEPHLRIAHVETAKIVPRNAAGQPAERGLIGLISISMSNATQEFRPSKSLLTRTLSNRRT